MKIKRKLIIIAVLLSVGLIYFFYTDRLKRSSLEANSYNQNSQTERVAAKDFNFRDLSNSKYTLFDFKGKVVILNFRTINCSACDTEVDFLKSFIPSLDGLRIEFLPIFLGDSNSSIERYLKSKGAEFKAYYDDYGLSAIKYGVFALPTSFVLDRDLNVVGKIPGAIDWNRAEIKDLLKRLSDE